MTEGLLVSTRTPSGELVNGTLIRFAQKSEHHDSKQPVLVVFSDEGHLKTEPGMLCRSYIIPSRCTGESY